MAIGVRCSGAGCLSALTMIGVSCCAAGSLSAAHALDDGRTQAPNAPTKTKRTRRAAVEARRQDATSKRGKDMTIADWVQHNACDCDGGCRTLPAVPALRWEYDLVEKFTAPWRGKATNYNVRCRCS